MRLSEYQRIFTKNIGCLIECAYNNDIELTMGDSYRGQSQVILNYFGYKVVNDSREGVKLVKSRKVSNTLKSNHSRRLAQDFNFFINGKLTYDKHKLAVLGEYWESLHPLNRWGGNFKSITDTPHFEMNV